MLVEGQGLHVVIQGLQALGLDALLDDGYLPTPDHEPYAQGAHWGRLHPTQASGRSGRPWCTQAWLYPLYGTSFNPGQLTLHVLV